MRRRGLAYLTRAKRRNELRRWCSFVPYDRATAADVERWLDERDLAPATAAATVSHLAAFYRWARRRGLADHDPTELVERARVPRRLPRPARLADVERAIEGAEPDVGLCLLLMVDAGLRCCEVAELRWRDVDLDVGTLRVHGKGSRERVVGIPARLGVALVDGLVGAEGNVVGPWTAKRVSAEVGARLRAVGACATAHQVRHLYATRLLAAVGGNVLAVSAALGHASVSTTQGYAEVAPSIALDAARRLDVA